MMFSPPRPIHTPYPAAPADQIEPWDWHRSMQLVQVFGGASFVVVTVLGLRSSGRCSVLGIIKHKQGGGDAGRRASAFRTAG